MKIAIAGKAGSGKTSLAEIFVNKYGFKRFGFANAVKQVGMDEYGLTWEQAFGHNKDRVTLQKIGHGRRIEFGETYWIDKFFEQIGDEDNIVIDDVRYRNEYDSLKNKGFILIKMECHEDVRRERIPNTFPSDPTHPSEVDLDDVYEWDVIVVNAGAITELNTFAKKIYKEFTDPL